MSENQQTAMTADELNRQLAAEMAAERAKHGDGDAADIPVVELADEPTPDEEYVTAEESVEAVPYPPGPVGDFAKLIEPMCRFPFRPFATVGALIAFATVSARKVRFENLYTSLYGFVLAASSNGKEDVQRVVEDALHAAGLDHNHLMSRVTSYNAAVEQLQGVWYHPALFAGVDEGAGFLDAARKGEYGLRDFLKEVWSKCGRWQYPWKRKRNSGNVNLQPIYHPVLNIFLAAQPEAMGASSDFAEIQDGLLPRCIWVVREDWAKEANTDSPRHFNDLTDTQSGMDIVGRLKRLWNWMLPFLASLSGDHNHFRDMAEASEHYHEELKGVVGDGEKEGIWPQPIVFGASPQVRELFNDFERECREKGAPGHGKQALLNGLWGKAVENAKRIALTLAVARCGPVKIREYGGPPHSPDSHTLKCSEAEIQLDEARWAIRFIRASVFSGIRWGRAHLFESPFQAQCGRVYNVIAAAVAGLKQTDLTRRLQHQYRAKDVREALDALEADGRIQRIHVSTKGRTADGWRAVGKRK